MKHRILKILGIGISAGLVFVLIGALFAAPISADLMKWSTMNTPSWEDNVIAPGTDIFDYAVGPDGETIYATGAITTADVHGYLPEQGLRGVSGGFVVLDGEITVTAVSDDLAEVTGWFEGDACHIIGDFTVIGITPDFAAALTGTITGDPDASYPDDRLEFEGKLYNTGGPDFADDYYDDLQGELCVNSWILHGDVEGFSEFIGIFTQPRVWKSEDAGVTWTDITSKVQGAANLPGPFIMMSYGGVAVAPDDEDWVAFAGLMFDPSIGFVRPGLVASKDGASNFSHAGYIEDTTAGTAMALIYDLAISPEVDDIHNIAVAGVAIDTGFSNPPYGAIFRLKAGTWLGASWEDTTTYAGWDSGVGVVTPPGTDAVVAVAFSPNFDIDDTILCMCSNGGEGLFIGHPYLQSGIWETTGAWNDSAGFPPAVEITSDGDSLMTGAGLRSMGLALPNDYDGSDPGARSVFVYVDAWNETTELVGGYVFRIDNASVSEPFGPSGDPLLASIAFYGDADTGKMMVGTRLGWDNSESDDWGPTGAECCEGVAVYHTVEVDPCCPDWELACKNPSGPYMAVVAYSPDGEKAFTTTSGTLDMVWTVVWWVVDFFIEYPDLGFGDFNPLSDWALWGGWCDESAFSVSMDDAVSFNQIGLIDTDIDYVSDMAVCPDCGVIYISTINEMESHLCCCDEECWGGCLEGCYNVCLGEINEECVDECLWEDLDCGPPPNGGCAKLISQVCACDSVWRSYDDGDTWERVFHGDWVDNGQARGPDEHTDELLLRLPCDAIEDCCDQDPVSPSGTIYLGIKNYTDDMDQIFYSRDCGQCWNNPPATKIDIQDIAVESENIVYVLDADGYVSKSTQYGRRWSDAVDTDVGSGWSITTCCEEGFVLVGGDGTGTKKVAWSDDGGESWNLTEAIPGDSGKITLVCDPTCENTIYAAKDENGQRGGGVYRWIIDESTGWDDLAANDFDYEGIGIGRSDGTLYVSSDDITVDLSTGIGLCDEDRFVEDDNGCDDSDVYRFSGVTRNLTPCETACCGTEDWDYLICGLTKPPCGDEGSDERCSEQEDFDSTPNSLKICGCLSIETNTVLYAIDDQRYEVSDGSDGTVWSYEDCAAKMGPSLAAPTDGSVLDCEPCAGCDAANFTLEWERMCEACSYDVQIMDEDGNIIVEWVDVDITGDPPTLFVDGTMDNNGDYALECGMTYTWKVREANTSCECVHSPWSETWTFTVTVGAADAIQLLAPEKGAMGTPIENIGFSWSSVSNADSYSFVLSPNANLTGALVSQDMSSTAFNYTGPLDYGKAYYWQVIAWQDGTRLTTSSIGVFNTMAEPEAPTPPVVVEEQPAPTINIPPAQQITPTWIYVIIGVGCALAVVVIVLIVRTRRP